MEQVLEGEWVLDDGRAEVMGLNDVLVEDGALLDEVLEVGDKFQYEALVLDMEYLKDDALQDALSLVAGKVELGY